MNRKRPEPVQVVKQRRDAALNALVQGVPYIQFLGISFERHGDELTALLAFDDKLIGNPMLPALHGGVTAAFLEVAAIIELSWSYLWEDIESGKIDPATVSPRHLPRLPKTIDFTVDFLRTGLPRDAYARARVNRSGRRYASVHVEAWQDNRSRLFAQATGHFLMPTPRRAAMKTTAIEGGRLSHGRVLKIALPIMISNATVPILGAVDTGVVGQLGQAAPIGAVGIGAIILTSVYWLFGFLRMGTVGLTSQAQGAGDRPEVSALLSRALLIGVVAGLGLIALQVPLFWGAFIVSPHSAEVEGLAREYLVIRVWSAPAAIAIYGITGWLIALERARAVLALQLWMNGVNILLDLWFVLGLGWSVGGVAFATFLAEWSGFALGLWLCRGAFASPAWRDWARVFDRIRLRQMAALNRDILLRSLMLEAIFVSLLFLGADFGDVTLAANQILVQFLHITAYALDGFAFAAEALVGQALGARDRALLRRGAVLTSGWGGGAMVLLAVAFAASGGWIIDVMTTAPEVRIEARGYLWYMVAAPVLGLAAWMLDGIFIGATGAADMRNMMAVSLVVYVIAVIVLVPLIGNHGLWLALLISLLARGVTLGLRYPALERMADRSG